MTLAILKPGLLTTVQDRGRRGHAALGVSNAGPMDDIAFRLANALVGNGANACALELTLVGPRLRFDAPARIALAGAPFAAQLDGIPIEAWRTLHVGAGSLLDCGRARRGSRAYLAITGGLEVDAVLGSASTDVNAQLGPFAGRPLREGDVLRSVVAVKPSVAAWSLDPRPWFDADSARPIRLIRGSHFNALDAASRAALFGAGFRIATDSNRVGFRLDGPRLALQAPLELISEPAAFGTLQLPPGGQPIALMAEHPTTGGYPRIGQIAAIDLPCLAQRCPGDPVRFVEIDIGDAQTRYLRQEHELACLVEAIAERLQTES